jgi:hypothetical protein
MPDNHEKPVNLHSVTLGLPKTPTIQMPSTNVDGAGNKNMSVNEMFLANAAKVSPKGVADIPLSSIYQGNRYAKTRVGTDYEEMAAQQQSALSKIGNDIVKFAGVAGTSFVSGTAGLLYGIGSAARNNRLAGLIDNDVTRGMDNIMTNLEDQLPNYYTHAEQDAKWYSPDNILTVNFWSDKVLKNLGYSVGAMAGGVAWGSVLRGIGLTNKLVQAGKGLEAATAIEQSMAAAPKLGKYAAFENTLNSLAQQYVKSPIGAVLTDSDRILTSAMGTFGEASMEGLQGLNKYRNDAIEDYKKSHGFEPTGAALDKINSEADKLGVYIWGANSVLLTATNYIQLPKILSSSRKADKALINKIEQEALGGEFAQVLPKSTFGRITRAAGSTLKSLATGKATVLFAPSEAFEEGMQSAIQTGVGNYFKRAYDNRDQANATITNIADAWGNIFTEGIADTLTTKEGLESILIGGLSGGLQQSGIVGTYKNEKGQTRVGFGKSGLIGEQGLFGLGGERQENTQTALEKLNKSNIRKALKDQAKFIAIGIGSQQLRQEAIANNDLLSEKDYEKDFTLSYVMPRAKYGKIASVNQELDYYKNQAMSDTGFTELVTGGIVNQNETREEFIQRIESLKTVAKNVDNLYSTLNDKYEGLVDKNNNRLYDDSAIDKMVYAASKIKDYDERIPGINESLIKNGIVAAPTIDDVIAGMPIKDSENYAKAIAQIDAMNIIDEEKEDLKKALDDLAEVTGRRQLFIEQYNDIKNNPAKYKDVEESKLDDESFDERNVVKIKTKDGEANYVIGKKYFLGEITEYTEDGHPVFRTPTVKILGKNDDGTIQMYDVKTKEVFNVSPEKLESYDLQGLDETIANPLAKFTIKNRNTLFQHKGFKDKDGNPRQGRVRYNAEKDILEFYYLDARGKERSKPVTTDQFEKQKGFTLPMIEAISKLTVEQETSIRELLEAMLTDKAAVYRESVEARNKIVKDLYEDGVKRAEEIKRTLERNKNEIEKIAKQIEDSFKTKQGQVRKRISKSLQKQIDALIDAKANLEAQNSQLLDEQADLEFNIPFFQSMLDEYTDFEGGSQEFLDKLKSDIKVMEDLVDVTKNAIKENERMIDLIDQLFNRAVELFNDYIKRVKEEFPNIPLSIDQLQTNVERFLGEEGAKQYIKDKLGFTEQVLDLESEILGYEKELDVEGLNNKADRLVKELEELKTGLDDLINRQIATVELLNKFQSFVDEQNKLEEEEKALATSKQRKEDLVATKEEKAVQNKRQGAKYEPVAKKPATVIGRATVAPDTGKPHQARANRFGARLNDFPEGTIFGRYVTKKNQGGIINGLIEHLALEADEVIDEDEVITMVMVNADGIPVNEFGEPIPAGADLINNAIYQVFPKGELKWSEQYGGESMFREGTADNVIQRVTKMYNEWRDSVLELEDLGNLHTVSASFGIPEFVMDAEGNPDFSVRNTVQETGLMTQEDLDSKQMISIPKLETEGSKGLTKYANAIGKVFLNLANSIVPLQNKKHTRQEAKAIFDAIVQLARYASDPSLDLTDPEPTRILTFLKSVVYWGIPIDSQGNKKPAGYNSIFFETDARGKMMLTISNKGLDFSFTPTSLLREEDAVIEAIMDIHNNVNSLMASNTNDSYEQILSVNEQGEVESIIWPNYQSYLLSDKMPAEDRSLTGPARDKADIPLTTAMRALNNEEDVNRRGIYFYTTDNADDYTFAEEKKKRTVQAKAKKAQAKKRRPTTKARTAAGTPFSKTGKGKGKGTRTTKSTSKTSPFYKNKKKTATKKKADEEWEDEEEEEFTPAKKGRIVIDGATVNEYTFPIAGGKTIQYVVHPSVSATNLNKSIFILEGEEDYDEVVAGFKKAGANPAKEMRIAIFKAIEKQESNEEVDEEDEYIDDEIEDIFGDVVVGAKTKSKTKKAPMNDTDEEAEFSGKSKNILKQLLEEDDEDDDKAMRERILSQESEVETEDWDEVAKWLKANFPLLPVYRLKNIIQGPNGKQAWGVLKNSAIYLYENAEVGTTYHEVFEAVWKLFSDPKEQTAVRNEFRNREGSFLDRPSQQLVKYSEATDHQIKEQLAEEFRDYIKDNKVPPKPKDGRPFIVKLFSDIWTSFKNFFLGQNSTNNTERLFEKIGTGYYAKNTKFKSPMSFNNSGFIDEDSIAASDDDDMREKLIIDDKRRSEIIEHMTYETLLELTKNDQNLFNDPSVNKAVMYDNIKNKLQRRIAKKMKAAIQLYENGDITKRKRNELIKDANNLITAIDDQWDELIDKHEEYLKGYNVEFDENDELQLTDDDQIKESDKFDATKIDAFKKANRAIKLLLSTIPYVDDRGHLEPSSINGARLLPVSQVNITLLNNLSGSRNTDEMIENLRKLAENDVNYRVLYSRLVKQDYSQENPSLENIKSPHATQMITAFWKLFKKYNSIVKMVSVLENGEVVVKNSYLSNAAEQLRTQYIDGVIINARSGNGFFKYDSKKKVFIGQPSKVLSANVTNKGGMVKFLSQLGIDFTTQELNRLEVTSPKDYEQFKVAVGGIKKSISNKEAVATFSGKTLSIGSRLYQLAEIKAKISNPEVDSTFYNINGDMTQSYIGPNAPSQLYEFLSDVKKFDAANVGNDPQFSYLITDNFAKGSVILKRLFSNGERRETPLNQKEALFAVGYAGGYENAIKGKSKPSSKLNYRERLIEEVNLNIAGWYNNLVPGDSSLGHIVYLGNETSYEKLSKGMSDVNLVFRDYFISEVLVSKERNRPFVQIGDRKKTDLRFFKSILGQELHQDVVEFAKGNTAEDTYKKFEGKINSALNSYINSKNDAFKATLKTYNILKEAEEGEGFTIDSVALPQNIGEKQVDLHLKALTINYMIANIEMHKLLYSDPYQYKDELKRTKSFNSPRQLIVGGKDKMNVVFNKIWNQGYEKGDVGYTNFTQPYFRTVTFQDVVSYSGLLNYGTFKETDGSGIVLFKAYRNFRIRAAEWNDSEERQYRYDIAWEKRDKAQIAEAQGNKKLADQIYKTISFEESELLDRGNPQIQSAYTALKPIVTGSKADGKSFNDVILDKFALYPLSYRVMKEMNADSNSVKLHDKLQRENIDYIVFDSARKVGAQNSHAPYVNGEFNEAPFIEKGKDKNIINVPFEIMGVQSDVPSKEEALVRRGTQPTKLITMDFLEAGIPSDFMEKDSFEKRYEKWYSLTEDAKKEISPLYREIKDNQLYLEVLIEKGYNSLLRSLGIEEVGDKYIVDLSEAGTTLRDEILKRHVNDNISDALKGFINGKVSLEATPAYQQVRNILYSIASREVISPKVSGGLKVQIPVTFFEDGTKVEAVDINGKPGYESDSLAFYSEEKDENGKRVKVNVCEIMVGRWFKSDKTDAELLKYLNETEEGQKILSGLAYRIPTQKQNSIDVFKIKQFLPKEFGDSVVIPSALVKKVGSDFDIDKLSIYLKNVKVGKNGYPKYIKLLDDSNSTPEERYYEWVLENSKRDTKDYIQYLSKGVITNLRKEFEGKLNELRDKYRSDISYKKEQLYTEYLESSKDILKGKLTEQEIYLEQLFDKSRDVFFGLSNAEQTDYFLLRDEMRKNNINGPIELENYLTLTLGKLETVEDEEDLDTLNDLVTLYTEQLRVLGAKDGYLKSFKASALEIFKNTKVVEIDKIIQERNEIFNSINEEEKEASATYKMEVAQEMATIDELPDLEEFKKMSIISQNTKKAVENAYIQSGENLVSHPNNYDRLIQPNSADQMKALSAKIAKKTLGKTFEYSNVGNMLDRTFMTTLRHAFVTGKYAIGIAAVNQTNHSLNQRQFVFIDRLKIKEMSAQDSKWLDDGSIKFDKYNKVKMGNRVVTTLSMVRNAERSKEYPEGQDISDIIGQFIDGYVDISAGPWIMEFGATPNVASTWLFLVKIGVPIADIAFFMNQPIIRHYLRSIENDGYSYLFMESYMEKAIMKFSKDGDINFDKLNALRKDFKIPNANKLEKQLDANVKDMSKEQLEEQQVMLMEFLKYAKLAEQLFHVTQGTNFDTSNFNDPTLVFKKQMQLDKARATVLSSTEVLPDGSINIISAADAILDNSFLGELAKGIGDIRNALATLLKSDQKKVRGIIQKVILPYVDKSDREFVKIAQKATNDFLDWAVQCKAGDNSINRDISKILIRRGGIGKEVLDFVTKIKKDIDHPLHNNHVIKILEVKPSPKAEEGGPTNIKIKGLDNKVYDQNNIIYAFREIKNYLETTDQSKPEARIYDKIKLLAVLQSGLSTSAISFTSVIPYEDFEDMYDEIISKLETIPNLDDFHKLGVFERNNYNNDDFVPYKKATWVPGYGYNLSMKYLPFPVRNAVKSNAIPPVMTQSIYSREAQSEYMVYSWEDQLPANVKKKMRDMGDFSYINKGLFRKVINPSTGLPFVHTYTNDEGVVKEYFVYKAINAWGDSFRANEFYDHERKSVINNGFIKVDEEQDGEIIRVFKQKRKATTTDKVKDAAGKKSVEDKIKGLFGDLDDETTKAKKAPKGSTATIDDSSSTKVQRAVSNLFGEEPVETEQKEISLRLKDGNVYKASQVNAKMLIAMGHTPLEAGQIIKKLC